MERHVISFLFFFAMHFGNLKVLNNQKKWYIPGPPGAPGVQKWPQILNNQSSGDDISYLFLLRLKAVIWIFVFHWTSTFKSKHSLSSAKS